MEEIEKKICGTDPEYRRSKDEILSLREAIARQPKHKRKLSSLEDRRGKLLHFFSQRTKGKVRDKCTALHRCLGKDKSFATLTFIEHISDARAVKLLNKFLTALRERFERLNYIYVIERQPDSGRPHFHLIVNKFLPVRQINALWTLQQYNEGLSVEGISRGQVEEMITYDREHPDEKSELQKVLNPFDVKKIRNINGLSYYLTKYITKGNNSGGFGCAVWHCSRVVSRLFTKTIVSRSTFAAAGSYINSRLDKKTGELIKNKGKHEKFYSLFYIENRPFFLPDMERLEFVNWALTEGMNVSKILYYDEDGKPDLDLSNN